MSNDTVAGDAPKGELISRDKLFVCPQAVNSVTRVTVEGEPAQAVPAFTKDCPCECGAYGGPGSHAHWCKFASPPAGTPAAPRLTEGHLPVARVIELLRECFIVTGENQFRNGRHFYRSLGHADHVCEHDLINFARAIERALLAQGNQEGAAIQSSKVGESQ